MLIEIKKPLTRKKLDAALKKLEEAKRKPKGFDAKKFLGVVKWKGDAVKLQRKWRNEWS